MRLRLKTLVDCEKTLGICFKTRLSNPARGRGCRHPKCEIERNGCPRFAIQAVRLNASDTMIDMHLHASFAQNAIELFLHAKIVCRQNGCSVRDQVKLNAWSIGHTLKRCFELKLRAQS